MGITALRRRRHWRWGHPDGGRRGHVVVGGGEAVDARGPVETAGSGSWSSCGHARYGDERSRGGCGLPDLAAEVSCN